MSLDTAPLASPAARAYRDQCDDELRLARDELAALEALRGPHDVASLLEPLNDLLMRMDRVLDLASFRRDVHPDPEVRAVADACEQAMQQVVTSLHLSRAVYDAVRTVDASTLDDATRHWLDHALRDFRRAGVDRDEPTRARVRELQDELVRISQRFSRNIREDVRGIELDSRDELAGLPADYVAGHAPGPDGKIRITTDYPDYVPFMTYAESDDRRRELYVAYRLRGFPQNLDVLHDLLARRHELAHLLGYPSWAAYATEDKMMKSPERAYDFIERVAGLARERAQRDYDELLGELRAVDPRATAVSDWQKTFLEERVRRKRYAFDSQEARAYFAYDDVARGVLETASRLFGVSFVRLDEPLWHPRAEAYEMRQGDETLGRFYLDMHPREGKYKHAAMFPLQAGVAGRRLPEACLVCNFPGGDGTRGLLEHSDVETFFHEFGHLLHHLLGGRQRWVGQSGIATEWDFVEAPSQMLEEWAWDAATLRTFARDEAGELIPEELVARMRAARDFGKGTWAAQQMFYAALSLALYRRDPVGVDTTAVVRELQGTYSPFAYVDGTYMQASFGHLDGYSAIYYTYMWSLVIAKDLFTAFAGGGLMDPAVASRYRRAVLEPGGSKDAAELIRDFLGRDVSFDAFARWLETGAAAAT